MPADFASAQNTNRRHIKDDLSSFYHMVCESEGEEEGREGLRKKIKGMCLTRNINILVANRVSGKNGGGSM